MFDKRYYTLSHIIACSIRSNTHHSISNSATNYGWIFDICRKNDCFQLWSLISLIRSNVSVVALIRLSLTFLCSRWTDFSCLERSLENGIITRMMMILSSVTHLNYTSSILHISISNREWSGMVQIIRSEDH